MIKNRAGWVAITVLVAATALMVFVVQPNLRGDAKKTAEEPSVGNATQSTETASGPQATEGTAKPLDSKAGEAADATANAAATNAAAENSAVPGSTCCVWSLMDRP